MKRRTSGWGERRGFKLRQEVEIVLMAFAHLSTFPQAASGAVAYIRLPDSLLAQQPCPSSSPS